MKTTTRNLLILLVLVTIAATCSLYFSSPHTIMINDEEVTGVVGFGAAFVGIIIAALACIFAVIVTSAVLAGVSALLIFVFAALAIAFALAVAPLCLPLLLLVGIVMFFNRRKSAKTVTTETLAQH